MKRQTPQEYFSQTQTDTDNRLYLVALTLGVVACVAIVAIALKR